MESAQMRSLLRWLTLFFGFCLLSGCGSQQKPIVLRTPPTSADRSTPWSSDSRPVSQRGFSNRRHLEEHFRKHGAQFNAPDAEHYLALAQALRDKPVGGDVLEAKRPDGSFSRFDKASGAFIACNADGTIRTFFKPNDGERYFRRQSNRPHD